MADSKAFKLNGIEIKQAAEGLQAWFINEKKLHAEALPTDEGYLVQAKQEDGWKKFAGMDSSVQVQLYATSPDQMLVNVGSGQWVDKAGAATIGMIAFAPLAVTAAIGAWGQKKMPQEIFSFLETFIMSGGKNVFVTPSTQSTATPTKPAADQIECPNCHAMNPAGSKFCQSCGTKLSMECPNCGTAVPLGTKFCPNCGTNLMPDPPEPETITCPDCGTELPADTKFCPNCGHSFVTQSAEEKE